MRDTGPVEPRSAPESPSAAFTVSGGRETSAGHMARRTTTRQADGARAAPSRRGTPITVAVKTASPEKVRSGVVVVGVFADGALSPAARSIDRAARRRLSAVIKRGDL